MLGGQPQLLSGAVHDMLHYGLGQRLSSLAGDTMRPAEDGLRLTRQVSVGIGQERQLSLRWTADEPAGSILGD